MLGGVSNFWSEIRRQNFVLAILLQMLKKKRHLPSKTQKYSLENIPTMQVKQREMVNNLYLARPSVINLTLMYHYGKMRSKDFLSKL